MRRRLLLTLALALIGLARTASADEESSCEDATTRSEAAVACPEADPPASDARHEGDGSPSLARWLGASSRSIGDGEGVLPTPLNPFRVLYAAAFPFTRFGLWAQGTGFALGPRATLYDVQGGAALRLGAGMSLTACYRLLGADFGSDDRPQTPIDGDQGIAAPFIGIALDF